MPYQVHNIVLFSSCQSLVRRHFLHTTGTFKPDSVIGLDGTINSKQSEKYQKEVLKKCFPQQVGSLRASFCASVVFFLLLSASGVIVFGEKKKVEKITGVVVAYDDVEPWLTCIDVCHTSLIVRTNGPNEAVLTYSLVKNGFKAAG